MSSAAMTTSASTRARGERRRPACVDGDQALAEAHGQIREVEQSRLRVGAVHGDERRAVAALERVLVHRMSNAPSRKRRSPPPRSTAPGSSASPSARSARAAFGHSVSPAPSGASAGDCS